MLRPFFQVQLNGLCSDEYDDDENFKSAVVVVKLEVSSVDRCLLYDKVIAASFSHNV